MRIIKRCASFACAIILAVQTGGTLASGSTGSVGSSYNFVYTQPDLRNTNYGSTSTYVDMDRSDVNGSYDRWSSLDTSQVYRDIERYAVDGDDLFLPDNSDNLYGNLPYGYMTETRNYRVPYDELKELIDRLYELYPDGTGDSNFLPAWTMFNEGSALYSGTPSNNAFPMGSNDFYNSDNSFRLNGIDFTSLSAMYRAANSSEKETIRELVKKAVEESGVYSGSDEDGDGVTEVEEAVEAMLTETVDYEMQLNAALLGLQAALNSMFLDPHLRYSMLTDEQKSALLAKYRELHGHNDGHGSSYGDYADIPGIDEEFWNFFSERGYTLSPGLLEDVLSEGDYTTRFYQDIVSTYNNYFKPDQSNDQYDGQLQNFNNNLFPGGLYDYDYMPYRYGLAEYILEQYANCGVENIDLTRVLDYRIKSLWIGDSIHDSLTGRYVWTVEKEDSDGEYTMISATDYVSNTHYGFRPTSKGRYRITCYPEYQSDSINRVASFATEYTILTDVGNVILSEQNFEARNSDGDANLVSSMDGNAHKSIDEYTLTNSVTHPWDEDGQLTNSGVETDPLYRNQYARAWVFDVDDAMLDHVIIDFDHGTIRDDYDTERIE